MYYAQRANNMLNFLITDKSSENPETRKMLFPLQKYYTQFGEQSPDP